MKLAFPSIDFDHAVAATCHGTATEEQLQALNILLRSDPAARDEYILRLELHARLASDPDLFADASAEPLPASRIVTPPPQLWRRPKSLWLLALAACVTLLLTGMWWAARAPRKGSTSNGIAMLNRVADAVWQQPGVPPRLGAPLEPGWLRLESGLAQIVFYSGARLVIEGPADVQLVSPTEAICLRGRMIAEVPPAARGFRVGTPLMKVTDLGTVFGLSATARETQLHVFDGRVEYQSPAQNTPQALPEGQAAIADATSPLRRVPADRSRFTPLFDLQHRSSQNDALHHAGWRNASTQLDEDPTLLVHFDFEQGNRADWHLANSSNRKDAAADGVIVGCRTTEGRWADKQALEFRGAGDRVRMEVGGDYDALTLAAWVRVQGLDRQINSLFMSDGFEAGTVHWSIREDGVLALTAIGSGPGNFQICATPPALTLGEFGIWMHLAVVVDGRGRRVTHYLNGTPLSEQALRIRPPFRIGAAELGNWNARGFPKADPFMIRNFSGALDDFCLFGRALTPSQIRALYAAGKPQPEPDR